MSTEEHGQCIPELAAVRSSAILTLAIDFGGSGIKAAVLESNGSILSGPIRVDTPYPALPEAIVDTAMRLAAQLPSCHRASVGFPGVVRDGAVVTAPHYGTVEWQNFALADVISSRLSMPVRLLNDADMQGFGAISGRGLEFVMTLGTGLGTALFRDGELMPHMEFAHFRFRGKTFNAYIGDAERKRIGLERWNRRVAKAIDAFRILLCFDSLYIGGGNATRLTIDLDEDVHVVSNDTGLTGGIRLWQV